ncbi:MAG: energy transducer TonB [Polyangiaceae bacterium]
MKLDAWTTGETVDAARRKRLTVGYAVGAVTVAVALTFVTYSAHGQAFEADDTLDVTLAQPPVEVTPEPEAEPEPEPKPRIVKKKKARSGKLSVATPTNIPEDVPAEADPNGNPYDGDLDDAFGEGGGGGEDTPATKPVVHVQRPKPAAPPAPLLVAERESSVAPVALARPRPPYPSEARAGGVEGTVTVRFLVSRAGSVSDVRVVQGHPLLNSAVISAVKQWRFQPGTFEGNPVPMWQTARFPFRLKA